MGSISASSKSTSGGCLSVHQICKDKSSSSLFLNSTGFFNVADKIVTVNDKLRTPQAFMLTQRTIVKMYLF